MISTFEELPDIDAANVVRCARVLLRRPLLRAEGPDGDLLPMIYRQRAALQDVFSGLLGYRLVVERRFARLYKAGPGEDAGRGVEALSPRGYAYFALTLAALTGIGRQVLLSRLVSDVRAAASEAGVEIADDPADRRALTAALRHLVSLGVITETEGSVTAESAAEALITIDTDMLGQLVSGPLAEANDPQQLVELASAAGPRQVEQAVRRKLIEDPVVLYADLPPEQASWLREHVINESRLLERFFGLVGEARAEGVVVCDPEDYLTDLAFPGPGTVARIALLALPELLGRGEPDSAGRHPVTWQDFTDVCQELVDSYPSAWSRQATEDHQDLARSVIELLGRLGLLREHEGSWLLSPAAHRWLPQPDATAAQQREAQQQRESEPPAPEAPGWSLFDEMEEAAR